MKYKIANLQLASGMSVKQQQYNKFIKIVASTNNFSLYIFLFNSGSKFCCNTEKSYEFIQFLFVQEPQSVFEDLYTVVCVEILRWVPQSPHLSNFSLAS